MKAKVLAASFKNAQQVLELMKAGVHSVTVPPDVARAMMSHPLRPTAVSTNSLMIGNPFLAGALKQMDKLPIRETYFTCVFGSRPVKRN